MGIGFGGWDVGYRLRKGMQDFMVYRMLWFGW